MTRLVRITIVRMGVLALVVAAVTGCGGVITTPLTALRADADHVVCFYLCGDAGLEPQVDAIVNRLELADRSIVGPRARSVELLALRDGSNGSTLFRVIADQTGSPDHTSYVEDQWEESRPMGESDTLADFLDYAVTTFPDAEITLVLFGASRGYSGLCEDLFPESDLLESAELARALQRVAPLSVVLDGGFTASIETAYEIARNAPAVQTLLAAPGAVPAEGWPYAAAVERFASGEAPTFADALIDESERAGLHRPWLVELSEIGPLAGAFGALSQSLADLAHDAPARIELRRTLFYDLDDYYATPGNLQLSIGSLATTIADRYPETADDAERVRQVLERSGPLTVHFIPLHEDGRAASAHHDDYMAQPMSGAQLLFVNDYPWAPNLIDGSGLLYRLFYEDAG